MLEFLGCLGVRWDFLGILNVGILEFLNYVIPSPFGGSLYGILDFGKFFLGILDLGILG